MTLKTKRFLFQISALALFMELLALLLKFILPDFFLITDFLTVFIFWILTVGLYLLVEKSLKKSIKSAFVNMFMAGSMAKLFIIMVYIVIYLFAVGVGNVYFLVFTLLNYIVFMVFEVAFLLKSTKEKK